MTGANAKTPRSFARRWSRRLGLGSLVMVVAATLLLLWLLATAAGRDTLLGRVLTLLPPESLSWQRAEGTVRGPLVFYGLRYQHDGVVFTAERLLLDPEILPVLGRRLQLDRLELDGALLVLPAAADEPFELPSWPDALPRLAMPLQVASARTTITGLRIERDAATLLDVRTLSAEHLQLADEGFKLESLAMDSDRGQLTLRGEYLPGRNYRTDLTGRLVIAASDERPAGNLQFSAKGDLDTLLLDAVGKAPEPLSLRLDLRTSASVPAWTLAARSEGLDLALFGAAPGTERWRFDLQAQGRGGEADVSGELAQGEWRVGIEPSQLVLADQQLRAEPLQLVLPQGPLRITGTLALAGEQSRFEAVLASTGLRLEPASGEPGTEAITAAGELQASGSFDAWKLKGDARIVRGEQQAALVLAGDGDREQLVLNSLRAETPTGTLDGSGLVRWSPALAFELEAALAGFDPGYFLPDYPGTISGRLRASGEQDAGGAWRGSAQVEGLSGRLRERPVSGRLAASWGGDRGEGDLSLRIGDSSLEARGGFGAVYDLQAKFSPLHLADLLAGASGRLQGTLAIRGPATAPDYSAELDGLDLNWGGQRAESIRFSGTLPARGDAGAFELKGEGLVLSGLALETLAIQGRGSLANLQLGAEANGKQGTIAFAGRLGRDGSGWRGRLASLRLAAVDAPVLALEDGADFAFGSGRWRLDRTCLAAETVGGRLCASATADTIRIEGDALPLALAQPWLASQQGLTLEMDGALDLRVDLQRGRGGAWRGDGAITSERGALRLDEDLEREVFAYRALDLQLRLADDRIEADLSAGLDDEGSVSAELRTGLAPDAALTGALRLDVRNLTWLELFSEDLAAPSGQLQGQLTVAGTRANPTLSGDARLQRFAAELPGLGLKLADGDFTLLGNVDGSARLTGSVRSGAGLLNAEGSLNFLDPSAPLQLVLRGEKVTLASTPELYLIANPDITLRWLDDRLELRGSLVVPEARLDLEALDTSVSVSPDVVVVDPLDGPRDRAKPLDMDFSVSLGDSVKLKGFGLDGEMTGRLSLRERPGRRATASGTLEASGQYRAYGRALTIQRARLGFADSAYDNPTLDIRAEREFEDVTVGVQVRGTARRPETTVISTPAMETSQALAWLVFGRPLSTTTGNENEQLGAAALALGAGGNLVAQQLGASLGLDEAGVSDSRNLGGATFTVGKYVSPRLFISYGISLVGTGQVVTLKYLLNRSFDISIESGNESAASLNWRREK